MKRILLLFLASLYWGLATNAQNKSNFHLGLSAQTKYMWRGIEYGTSPVLFPTLSYESKGIYIYGMGGYATDGSHQEVDLGISYTFKDFTLSINDYYYPTAVGEKDKYFNLKGKETAHWIKSCIQYIASIYTYKHIESHEEPHKIIRTLWALIFILLPIGLLFSENSMYGLQSISIIAAFPIGIIICLIVYSFFKDANNFLKHE